MMNIRYFNFIKATAVFFTAAFSLASIQTPAESGHSALTPATVRVRLEVPAMFKGGAFAEDRIMTIAPGMTISVFAAGLSGPRFMAIDPAGNLFVTLPSSGKVVVLPDKDHDGVADSIVVFASGLERPHGIAFRGADVIVAEAGRLLLLKDSNGDLKADSIGVLTDDIPSGGGHWTRTVVAGPDKKLYVSAGSSCNVCVEKDKRRAAILRFSGPKAEVFASGLRNSVGMAFNPQTHELWAVDNGRDLLGDDLPPEELNRIVEGGNYGWPYCYGDQVADPQTGSDLLCKGTVPPEVKMQAHSAPLGMTFGAGLEMSKELQDALFVAFHGSWNRSVPTGYKVVVIPFKDGRPSGGPVDFVTGWLDESGKAWGRPVDVIVGKDGALYVSDDRAGAIYRISAGKETPGR